MTKKEPCCKLDNNSVFLGLTSFPEGEEVPFVGQLTSFIEKYKDGWLKPREKHPIFKYDNFYIPKIYYLFSKFDIAVLSVIDSFKFPSLSFGSHDTRWIGDVKNNTNKNDFSHQVILSHTPVFDNTTNTNFHSTSEKLAKETFLRKTPFSFPLISITQLKLNNAILIGTGTDYTRCVIKLIMELFELFLIEHPLIKDKTKDINAEEEKRKEAKKYFDILILGSYSWHEITLLLFSTSYKIMLDFIISLRELDYGDMVEIIQSRHSEDLNKLNENPKLVEKLCENTEKEFKIEATHLFTSLVSSFGIDFDLLKNDEKSSMNEEIQDAINSIETKDTCINLLKRFSIKPGHTEHCANSINSDIEGFRVSVCSGRGGDLLLTHDSDKNGYDASEIPNHLELAFMSSADIVTHEKEILEAGKSRHMNEDVTSTYTMLSVNNDVVFKPKILKKDPPIRDGHVFFENLIQDHAYIIHFDRDSKDLVGKLLKYVPKVTVNRMLNAISKFNQGLKDRILFGSFSEISDFMHNFINKTAGYMDRDISMVDIDRYINSSVDAFETVWKNRYYSSWNMNDLSDSSIEFKGGIHLLISALSGAYKAITSVLGEKSAIALVTGYTRMFSDQKTVHINYFDLFQPEIFATKVTHEVAEHFLSSTTYRKDKIVKMPRIIPELIKWNRNSHEMIRKGMLNKKIKDPSYNGKKTNMRNLINIHYFREIFADMFSYNFTFHNDENLFLYWYRNVYIMDSASWRKTKNKIVADKDYLMCFIFRLLSIRRDISPEKILRYWNEPEWDMDEGKIIAMKKYIDIIYGSGSIFGKWYREAEEYVKTLYRTYFETGNTNGDDEVKEMMKHMNEGEVYPFDIQMKSFINNPISKSFDEKKEENARIMFIHTLKLLYSYLSTIKQNSEDGVNDINKVILRQNDENIPIDDSLGRTKIYYDRRGGTYIPDPIDMGKYLQHRLSLIMSLYDMHTKSKYYLTSK
ncbi:MAG: hypothetical protein P9X24_09945 [Candidatus Hatepunaea meridiana]|nr:hypothetical protein [Candidatus Hatepunaea meridiana]